MQAQYSWISGALVIVVLLATPADSQAITRRHDRNDSQYTALANRPPGASGKLLLKTREIDARVIRSEQWLGGLLKHYYRKAA